MSEYPDERIAGGNVGQVVNPDHRELVRDVQSGAPTFVREVKSVLRTARVHEAAEQLVGGVVDVLGERVVRAEVDALREAALEIDRHSMVRVEPGGGKRRY